MQKAIVLDQTTLCADGSIGIKLLKIIKDDDGRVLFSEPHRTSVDTLGTVEDQITAVNTHLAEMSFPAVPDAAATLIANLCEVQRSNPDVQARRASVEADRAAMCERVEASS